MTKIRTFLISGLRLNFKIADKLTQQHGHQMSLHVRYFHRKVLYEGICE